MAAPGVFRSLARAILSTNRPLLLLLDDLQWCDQDTLEWLHYVLRFDSGAPLLIVGTMRTEEVGPRHPLTTLLTDLRSAEQLTEIGLGPLNAAETAELGICVAGRGLDPSETAHLYDETEGQPLFVIETIRAGLTAGDQVPPKVHAVIAARLGQLSDVARETVTLAATIGRAFTLDLLIEASDNNEESMVGVLDELWQRRIVREHGTLAYDFSHDKIREVAYGAMSAARRTVLHRKVARALERVHGANLDAVSGQVATHYELYRCRGELFLARHDRVEAEVAIQRALAVSRYQGAKAIELRAESSFARLRLPT